MEKIETKVLYPKNNTTAWVTGLFIFIIGVTILFIFMMIGVGSNPGIISMVNFIILLIILSQINHIGHLVTQARVTKIQFEYDPEKKMIKIIFYKSQQINTFYDFKIQVGIQSRVSSNNEELIRKKFFHLKIIPKKGQAFNFFEEINTSDIPSDITTDPNIKYSFSMPISLDIYPGPIFKLYNLLKGNHLEKE